MAMHASRKQGTARRMGRPTAEESRQLDDNIKSVALNLFLDHGYDAVTMEAVAEAADITKRTLYARYGDKSELFVAALLKSKGEWASHNIDASVEKQASLEEKLITVADALLKHVLDPEVIKMARMATAQAGQFPEEIKRSYNIALSPRIGSVATILKHHKSEIEAAYIKDVEMTAELFLGLVTGITERLAGFGTIRSAKFERRKVRIAVRLFIEGIRKR